MDTLIPGLLGRGKGSLLSCPVEVFLKEFKRDAVAMYENNPDVSMNQVSKDLGINRGTLRYWIDQFGTGKKQHLLLWRSRMLIPLWKRKSAG